MTEFIPTSREVFAERRQRLQRLLAGTGIEAAVIASGLPQPRNFAHNLYYPFRASSHFLYLTGQALEGSIVSIGPAHATLYVDPEDEASALWTGPQPTLDELADRIGIDVLPLDDLPPLAHAACVAPVDLLTTAWLSDLTDRPLEPAYGEPQSEPDRQLMEALIELRLRHDAAAIAQMRAAIATTHEAHLAGMRVTAGAAHEYEVLAAMEGAVRRRGMTMAYHPIVTCHGEVLHNERHDNAIAESDLILADVGAETPEGWAADVTRTWPARGRFSATQQAVYEVVLASQAAALALVKPGVRYRDVHVAALGAAAQGLAALGILRGSREELVSSGAVATFFPHGVGHLLGLDVHDMEDLGDAVGYPKGRARGTDASTRYLRLDRDLEPGMVVTIEPGFYQVQGLLRAAREDAAMSRFIDFERLEEFADVRGIRIEDDVLVTPTGSEVLSSQIPKAVADVEAACLDSSVRF